jgi:hypothetical protein
MTDGKFITVSLANAREIAKGIYSNLLCPHCRQQSVEGYFSEQNLKQGYGIWLECQECKKVEHISCTSEPDGFSPLRISEKFQHLDDRAWNA